MLDNMAQPVITETKATQFSRFLRFVIDAAAIVFDRFGAKECISAVEQQSAKFADHLALVVTALKTGQDLALVQPKAEQEMEQASFEPAVPAYPAIGEVFELTLDSNVPENQPLQIVRDCGYTGKWRHNGRTVKGKQTRRFKFAQAGYQPDLDGVKAALPTSGSVEGQWIKAFKAAYPQPDGNGPVGIADASWFNPSGGVYFPIVDTDGRLNFYWADNDQDANWRWLVPAE